MPRRSAHKDCVDCAKPVEVCAFVSFYVVNRRSQVGRPRKQVKDELPTHGYCIDCFLQLAREQGLSKAGRVKLRQELQDGE
jgi:hypothetical protein